VDASPRHVRKCARQNAMPRQTAETTCSHAQPHKHTSTCELIRAGRGVAAYSLALSVAWLPVSKRCVMTATCRSSSTRHSVWCAASPRLLSASAMAAARAPALPSGGQLHPRHSPGNLPLTTSRNFPHAPLDILDAIYVSPGESVLDGVAGGNIDDTRPKRKAAQHLPSTSATTWKKATSEIQMGGTGIVVQLRISVGENGMAGVRVGGAVAPLEAFPRWPKQACRPWNQSPLSRIVYVVALHHHQS